MDMGYNEILDKLNVPVIKRYAQQVPLVPKEGVENPICGLPFGYGEMKTLEDILEKLEFRKVAGETEDVFLVGVNRAQEAVAAFAYQENPYGQRFLRYVLLVEDKKNIVIFYDNAIDWKELPKISNVCIYPKGTFDGEIDGIINQLDKEDGKIKSKENDEYRKKIEEHGLPIMTG